MQSHLSDSYGVPSLIGRRLVLFTSSLFRRENISQSVGQGGYALRKELIESRDECGFIIQHIPNLIFRISRGESRTACALVQGLHCKRSQMIEQGKPHIVPTLHCGLELHTMFASEIVNHPQREIYWCCNTFDKDLFHSCSLLVAGVRSPLPESEKL
nr:MAG TPA: hypothetical protein [Caudoviricetes sp.]